MVDAANIVTTKCFQGAVGTPQRHLFIGVHNTNIARSLAGVAL
jgi:hypothetical protein